MNVMAAPNRPGPFGATIAATLRVRLSVAIATRRREAVSACSAAIRTIVAARTTAPSAPSDPARHQARPTRAFLVKPHGARRRPMHRAPRNATRRAPKADRPLPRSNHAEPVASRPPLRAAIGPLGPTGHISPTPRSARALARGANRPQQATRPPRLAANHPPRAMNLRGATHPRDAASGLIHVAIRPRLAMSRPPTPTYQSRTHPGPCACPSA